MASLGNIAENPHVGLIFIDIYQTAVGLHLNGGVEVLECDDERLVDYFLFDERVEDKKPAKIERWVKVNVEEAYIHCSKHIPLVKKIDKDIHWGTDDIKSKGGDHFHVKNIEKPWGIDLRPKEAEVLSEDNVEDIYS